MFIYNSSASLWAKKEWRRHDREMEPQAGRTSSPFRPFRNVPSLGLESTTYGLSDRVDFQTTANGPGEVLCIPRRAVHRFDNFRTGEAKMLAVVTPGVLRPDYFREIAAVEAAAGGPPNAAAIVEVMRRHGLTPAP